MSVCPRFGPALEGRKERLEHLERDRDALTERYAGVVPESLDALAPKKRHQLYKMLRLQVVALPDESLEVSGAILAGGEGDGGAWPDERSPNGRGTDGLGLGALRPTQNA